MEYKVLTKEDRRWTGKFSQHQLDLCRLRRYPRLHGRADIAGASGYGPGSAPRPDSAFPRASQRLVGSYRWDVTTEFHRVSPRILDVEWGQTEVEGVGVVKDVKLWPGGGREWDWSETGTRHVPGILPKDVQELVDHGAEVVVLSRGMELMLETAPETLDLLRRLSVEVHVTETKDAVDLYNRLAESRAAGCLIHSTC